MRSVLMAYSASALVGIGILLSPTVATAANFAGTWAISGTIGDPVIVTATPNCTFQQDGEKISGSCEGPGSKGLADGEVDGRTVVWHWHLVPKTTHGLGGLATFNGVLGSDGTMSGTWTHSAVEGLSGKFTAQRQEQH